MTNQNKQQTAVEWLHLKLSTSSSEEMVGNINLWFKQAKEMEKEQRISDYYQGACDESDSHGAQYICKSDAEQWYNETYGGDK